MSPSEPSRSRSAFLGRSSRVIRRCLLLLCAAGLAGCGASRPVHYHSIDLPPREPRSAAPDPLPVSLLVGHLTAPHLYRENKLVYVTEDTEIHIYESHRWVEPPTEILEHLIVQALRESQRFRSVQPQRSSAQGDFLLRGHLVNFDEIAGSHPAARIRFEAELYDMKKGTTVWSRTYSGEEPVQGKGVSAIVASLQRATGRAVTALSSQLAEYLSTHAAPLKLLCNRGECPFRCGDTTVSLSSIVLPEGLRLSSSRLYSDNWLEILYGSGFELTHQHQRPPPQPASFDAGRRPGSRQRRSW